MALPVPMLRLCTTVPLVHASSGLSTKSVAAVAICPARFLWAFSVTICAHFLWAVSVIVRRIYRSGDRRCGESHLLACGLS